MVATYAVRNRYLVWGPMFVVGIVVLVDWLVVAVGEMCKRGF